MNQDLALFGGTKAIPENIPKKWPFITEEDKAADMRAMVSALQSHHPGN